MFKRIICLFLGHKWRQLQHKMKIKCARCGAEAEYIDIPYGHAVSAGI